MLRDIEECLTTLGLSSAYVGRLLQALASSRAFWGHQSKGLAIFLAPDSLHVLRLPYRFQQQAAVGNQFHIRPLLPLISADGRFYILTLERNVIELLQGTREGLDRVDLREVPEDLAQVWRGKAPSVRISTAGKAKEIIYRPAIFAGPKLDARKENERDILDYFRRLDKGLNGLLDGQVPLVLAGRKGYRSFYRSINGYP
ncbi:MAG: hypothetical protein U9R48_09865 [Chloroflexota bacterium]|nr:hypothetical protein [Chloroflexota bacterium]